MNPEMKLDKRVLDDELILERNFRDAEGRLSRKVDVCRSPEELLKAVGDPYEEPSSDEVFEYAVLTTRHWQERIGTYEELVGEAAYAAGDDGSFDEFEELVRRDAKYVCWYHNDLATDLYNTMGPDELLHVISVASEFCKEV